jgi:asparagine synthetase B (glutamine-hydrolysing)
MLTANVKEACQGQHDIALSFSGGTDSTCILLSCLELGIRPSLYCYAVEQSASEDLERARAVAEQFDLPLKIAWIPTDMEALVEDIKAMIQHGIRGTVRLQCMHGHSRLAPMVQERIILNGSGIDALYGVYRWIAIQARGNKPRFDEIRHKHLANPNDDAMLDQERCYARSGVSVQYPYRQPNVIGHLMGLAWEQINKPRLKYAIVKDYPEFSNLAHPRYFRPRGSQQIVAGTRALHETLLDSPWNPEGWKVVRKVYERIAASIPNSLVKT